MFHVVVGSHNPAKVEATRAVVEMAWPGSVVRGQAVPIPPSITEMPIGEQVRLGARHRAKSVLGRSVDLGIGLEGGVQFVGDQAYLFNWCVVADARGRLYESPSPHVLLPEPFAQAVRAGKQLGPVVAEWSGIADVNKGMGAVGLLTRGLLNRQAFFEQALLCALAPLLTPKLYGDVDVTGKNNPKRHI